MTDDAVTKELNKLFAEPQKVMIYPNTRVLNIKQETTDAVGVVITNLIQGGTGNEIFSYKVELVDKGDCKETEEKISSWITLGRENPKMIILPGESRIGRVTFKIPTGTSLCMPRFDVTVFVDGSPYGGDNFDIQVQPK
jgi:hypothetical protein